MIKTPHITLTQVVSVKLKDEYAEAYLYLKKLKINCANILKHDGQNGIYELAREFKFKNRIKNEKIYNPFDI